MQAYSLKTKKSGRSNKKGDLVVYKQRGKRYFKESFEGLYKSDFLVVPKGLEGVTYRLITDKENEVHLQILDEENIKVAIWELHPLKILMLDGFSCIFFWKLWSIIREEIINFVHKFFQLRIILIHINHTFLVLIMKVALVLNFN